MQALNTGISTAASSSALIPGAAPPYPIQGMAPGMLLHPQQQVRMRDCVEAPMWPRAAIWRKACIVRHSHLFAVMQQACLALRCLPAACQASEAMQPVTRAARCACPLHSQALLQQQQQHQQAASQLGAGTRSLQSHNSNGAISEPTSEVRPQRATRALRVGGHSRGPSCQLAASR